ncbi:MAG: hypothetical protein ABJF10_04715 [Chthoniobacter sp.]|uniref:hypothetical protein n=1 Tax=Chthoniobacter sp. TaxID=2510640 RepID=UPI0032AAAD0C
MSSDSSSSRGEAAWRMAASVAPRMTASILILLAAFQLTGATVVAGESAHDHFIHERSEQLREEAQDLARAPVIDQAKLADLHKRYEELEKDMFDFTKGEKDVCPVHQMKMTAQDARIAYGLLARDPQPDPDTRAWKFPFARNWIEGGCVISNLPKTGRVFLCLKCVEAEKAWIEQHKK